jgi:dehydrogenase/reductase SDR family protein 12
MNLAQLKKIATFYGRFLPSFSRIGYGVRRLGWTQPPMDFTDQHWLVTGASGGIGAAIARDANRHGATVVAAARSAGKLDAVRQEGTAHPGRFEPAVVDLALQRDVERFVDELAAAGQHFDVLVNNVGVLLDDHELTSEGREMSFATNLLNHYLLTESMVRRGLLHSGSIVISMSSGGMYNVPLMIAPLNVLKPAAYNGVAAYGFHKRAQVALTGYWNARYGNRGITFYVMHPGWADTAGVKRSLPRFRKILRPVLRDELAGADTALWLAAVRPPVPAGEHIWFDRAARPAHAFARTRAAIDAPEAVAAYLESELAKLPPAGASPA